MSQERPISDAELDALDESLSPGPVSPDLRVAQLEAALGQQEARLAGMLRIAGNLGQSRDPKKAMKAMVVDISQLLRADRTTIYEVRADEGMLRGLAVEGEVSLEVGVPVGTGIAGLVAERGRVINLKDAYLHPAFDPKFDKLTGYRTRSMLVVPMRNSRREIIGVVQVLNKCDGYFTVDDQALLTALAAQAAITLEALRLQLALNLSNTELSELSRQLRQKVRELELLYQNEQAIADAADEADLAEQILKLACRVGRSEVAALYLADAEAGSGPAWVRMAGAGPTAHIPRIEIGEGIVGKVASRGEVLVLTGGAFEKHAIPHELGGGYPLEVDDAVAVPLLDGDVTMGTFALINRKDPAPPGGRRGSPARRCWWPGRSRGPWPAALPQRRPAQGPHDDHRPDDERRAARPARADVRHQRLQPAHGRRGRRPAARGDVGGHPAQDRALQRHDPRGDGLRPWRAARLCRKVYIEQVRAGGARSRWSPSSRSANTRVGGPLGPRSLLLRREQDAAGGHQHRPQRPPGHGDDRVVPLDHRHARGRHPHAHARHRPRHPREHPRPASSRRSRPSGSRKAPAWASPSCAASSRTLEGTITFTTETGKGTEFVITRPPPAEQAS
ncbi:MAG: GAF domain-containing protein [bacterium]